MECVDELNYKTKTVVRLVRVTNRVRVVGTFTFVLPPPTSPVSGRRLFYTRFPAGSVEVPAELT